jgi:hypothetical protein
MRKIAGKEYLAPIRARVKKEKAKPRKSKAAHQEEASFVP